MSRILIIEDEESYREALAYMLTREGFDVVVAADGQAGLAEYDRAGADLVLLDLMMPGMPGTEVCRQLRSQGNVAIIMVSARDTEVDKVVGLELGADDYVTKPFSHRELVARIRAVLRRHSAENPLPEVMEADGVRIEVFANLGDAAEAAPAVAGGAAAIEAYRHAPTPNVIILETEGRSVRDSAAEVLALLLSDESERNLS